VSAAWGRLALAVIVTTVAFIVIGRLPKREPGPVPAPPPAPIDTLVVTVRGDSVAPMLATVQLRHRLALTRVNAGLRPARISLAGYEHALPEALLAPGSARTDTFLLELPGEDFAWRLDGEPVGRLRVAGSHLLEGHR
jgi:hypothetical protein